MISTKELFALCFTAAVVSGCPSPESRDRAGRGEHAVDLSSYEALEKVMRDYFAGVEKEVRMDLGVSEEEVTDRVQFMIDQGYVKEPAVLVITPDGPEWEKVNYATYKTLMKSDAVTSRRYHKIQPQTDSLKADSIKTDLLKALKESAGTPKAP